MSSFYEEDIDKTNTTINNKYNTYKENLSNEHYIPQNKGLIEVIQNSNEHYINNDQVANNKQNNEDEQILLITGHKSTKQNITDKYGNEKKVLVD